MAAQALAFNVSAAEEYYYLYNGVYYSNVADATYEAQGSSWEAVLAKYVKGTQKWYSYDTHTIYDTEAEARKVGSNYHIVYVAYTSSSYDYTGSWYSSYTGKYYTTYAAALAASKGIASYVTYVNYGYYDGYYNGANYYSTVTGKYYTTYAAALAASNNDPSKVVAVDGYYGYNYKYAGYYYSSYTGKYYTTYAAALNASRGNASYVTYVGYNGYYYNNTYYNGSIYKYYYNGVYYGSLQDAINAGGTKLGTDIFYVEYGSTGDTVCYYYYNGKYYGSLAAAKAAGGTALGDDIYYVPKGYFGSTSLYTAYGTIINPYGTSSVITSTSTTTASDGTPYIYGKSTKHGWSTIVNYLKSASKGETVKVDMNGSYVIDGSALAAINGKNINLSCVLDNGAVWTINGKDVDSTDDMNIYTEYSINYIPKALVKKAKTDAVASAQIGVSTNYGALSADASITVKFAKKRQGLTAVVYFFDPDTETLKGVGKSKVLSDGTCTFTVDEGGAYLIVLK
jgi:hypothetical protein